MRRLERSWRRSWERHFKKGRGYTSFGSGWVWIWIWVDCMEGSLKDIWEQARRYNPEYRSGK